MGVLVELHKHFRELRKIFLTEVLAEINKPHSVFEIGFYNVEGIYGVRKNITNRRSGSSRKKMNRNGLLNCYEAATDSFFDVTIDLIMTFNGMELIRPEGND